MGKKEDRIWEEGYEAACRVAESRGIDGLMAERRFRGVTGLHSRLTADELDAASDEMRKLIFATLRIAFVSVLHDDFGFGKTRIEKFLNGLDKISAYLDEGWIYWMDVVREIDDRLGINLIIANGEDHFRMWLRPENEDLYHEPDYINRNAWQARLNYLGLKDDGKGHVTDRSKSWDWKYENAYDKIQIYDELGGIVLAVNALGAVKPGDDVVKESVEANITSDNNSKTQNPTKTTKLRKRRKRRM